MSGRPVVRASTAVVLGLACCGLLVPAAVLCAGGGGGRTAGEPAAFTTGAGSYVSSYDHLDVNRLLKNDKLVTAYVKCFLDEGHCTAEAKQVKVYLLPDIIRTVCSKCSPRQKEMARQVLTHVYKTRRSDFEKIMKLYDSDNKYNAIIEFMNERSA